MSVLAKKILSTAKSQYKDRLFGTALGSVEVPEWECTLYYKHAQNLKSKDVIMKAVQRGGLEHMADVIVEVACDADGKLLFKANAAQARKDFMERVDPDVIMRVAGEMSDALVPDDESDDDDDEHDSPAKEAEKNLDATTN